MTSAFFSMGVASLALAIGLYQGVSQPGQSRIGLALLGLWSVGVLIAMTFPIDLEGAPPTASGTIHRINGPLAFLSLTAGAILVAWRFKHDEEWRPLHRPAMMLAMIMLAAYIATPLAVATNTGFPGLIQRIYLATFLTWAFLTAARLRSIVIRSVPAR